MVGLVITGRTYNPETYEISLQPTVARVIDTGTATIRIWPNGISSSIITSVDFLICSPYNGESFSETEVVRIPFYLLNKINGAEVNTDTASLVKGKTTNFYTNNGTDFSENIVSEMGGIITKAKCPKIIWNGNVPYSGFSDFYVCYPTLTSNPPEFNKDTLIFIEEISSNFISPTFVGGSSESSSSRSKS